jgi:hypothetical protein
LDERQSQEQCDPQMTQMAQIKADGSMFGRIADSHPSIASAATIRLYLRHLRHLRTAVALPFSRPSRNAPQTRALSRS